MNIEGYPNSSNSENENFLVNEELSSPQQSVFRILLILFNQVLKTVLITAALLIITVGCSFWLGNVFGAWHIGFIITFSIYATTALSIYFFQKRFLKSSH